MSSKPNGIATRVSFTLYTSKSLMKMSKNVGFPKPTFLLYQLGINK
jgi:hypothetical protein